MCARVYVFDRAICAFICIRYESTKNRIKKMRMRREKKMREGKENKMTLPLLQRL